MIPGAIVHTRTPQAARSRAAGRVMPMMPALGGRICGSADLALVTRNRGGVYDHAALALTPDRLETGHVLGRLGEDVEGSREADVENPSVMVRGHAPAALAEQSEKRLAGRRCG